MHLAKSLWKKHGPSSYPPGVLPVPTPIVGTAFFPGGFGLWNPEGKLPLPLFPRGGVMVLGHDFHSEAGYAESLARGAESLNQPTWKNLLDVFDRAGIRPAECFFTNAYMGLRMGTTTTGPFPGARDADFVAHCVAFLAHQIDAQRPSLIVTLGTVAPRVLSRLSPDLSVWNAASGLTGLNNSHAVIGRVTFSNLTGFSTTAVALIHPCLRGPNLRHRKYRGLVGDAAEIRMLGDARRIVASRAA